jgi:hypothetical protein
MVVVVRMAGNVGHGGGRHLSGCDGRRGRVRCHSLVAPAHLMDSRSREPSVIAATTSSLGRVFGFGVGVTLRVPELAIRNSTFFFSLLFAFFEGLCDACYIPCKRV